MTPVAIQQEYVTLRNSAGDAVALTGPIYLTEHDGLGLVRPRRFTRSGPQQHGQSLGAAYLQPRVVTLRLHYHMTSEPLLETHRGILQTILNDLNHQIYLDVTYPSGHVRRLDVYYYDGMPARRAATDLYYNADDVLQLIADDPVFYDPTPITEVWRLEVPAYYLLGGGLTIPWRIPFWIAPSTISETARIDYEGGWESYPVWAVTGPASRVRIHNLTTDEVIQFTDASFVEPGDIVTVDLRYGHKDVRNLVGESQIAFITDDSDIATWHLAPHAEAIDGRNVLRILASDCTEDTRISMTYYLRYFGS